jgi:hypothetical protein
MIRSVCIAAAVAGCVLSSGGGVHAETLAPLPNLVLGLGGPIAPVNFSFGGLPLNSGLYSISLLMIDDFGAVDLPSPNSPFSLSLSCSVLQENCVVVVQVSTSSEGLFSQTDTGRYSGFPALPGRGSSEAINFNFSVDVIGQSPLPAALPLFATSLGALGLLGRRRKRKAQAVAV